MAETDSAWKLHWRSQDDDGIRDVKRAESKRPKEDNIIIALINRKKGGEKKSL